MIAYTAFLHAHSVPFNDNVCTSNRDMLLFVFNYTNYFPLQNFM